MKTKLNKLPHWRKTLKMRSKLFRTCLSLRVMVCSLWGMISLDGLKTVTFNTIAKKLNCLHPFCSYGEWDRQARWMMYYFNCIRGCSMAIHALKAISIGWKMCTCGSRAHLVSKRRLCRYRHWVCETLAESK